MPFRIRLFPISVRHGLNPIFPSLLPLFIDALALNPLVTKVTKRYDPVICVTKSAYGFVDSHS